MSRIDRQELEKPTSLDKAQILIDELLNNRVLNPDSDLLSRRGINKVLVEEYRPLLFLAKTVTGAEYIRLFPDSNKGADGEIILGEGKSWNVQITCSYESYQHALMREQLLDEGIAHQGNRHRDIDSGQVVNESHGARPMDQDTMLRKERILNAIKAKEDKYHEGTNTLLVLEKSARSRHLNDLHELVVNTSHVESSNYERIYIVYDEDVKRVKGA